jgi:hypothetical protein
MIARRFAHTHNAQEMMNQRLPDSEGPDAQPKLRLLFISRIQTLRSFQFLPQHL